MKQLRFPTTLLRESVVDAVHCRVYNQYLKRLAAGTNVEAVTASVFMGLDGQGPGDSEYLPMSQFLWFPWLIAFGGVATVMFLVTDTAQRFLYDEAVPYLGWRTLAMAMPYSFLLLRYRPEIGVFASLAVVSTVHVALLFPGLWLLLRFQWPHALAMSAVIGFLAYPILWLSMDRFLATT